jgi:hypothetical protein
VANLQYYDGTPATVDLSLEPIFGPGVETAFDFALAVFYPVYKNGWATGHHIAVECADRSQFLASADYAAVLQDEPVYGAMGFSIATLPNVCEQIDVEPVSVRTYRIHQVGVPSLVLAWSLEADTPPTDGAQVSDMQRPWSQYVEFPGAAHVVAGYSESDPASQCADQMIASFIDTPRQQVDTSCIGG